MTLIRVAKTYLVLVVNGGVVATVELPNKDRARLDDPWLTEAQWVEVVRGIAADLAPLGYRGVMVDAEVVEIPQGKGA